MRVLFFSRIVTYMMFFVVGSSMSLWAILIPYTRSRLGLNEAQLGSLLMLIGVGAMLAMAFAGRIVGQIGARKTIIVASALMVAMLFSVNFINEIALLSLVLVCLGVGVGIADVALNIQAVFVEKAHKKKLMSGFHSMYSGGSFVCGMIASSLLFYGLDIGTVVMIFCAVFIVILIYSFKGLSTQKGEKTQTTFNMPNLALFVCGLVCFAAYMSEGAFLDWSAIFANEFKNVPKESAGYGFALFFGAITFGRICGDYFAARFNTVNLITVSGFIATLGLLLFIFSSDRFMLYIGAIVAGLGASNMIPFVISAIPRIKGNMSLNSAIAAVTTLGYSGTLLGPAIIGYVAHWSNLLTAFCMLCGLLCVVALIVKMLDVKS